MTTRDKRLLAAGGVIRDAAKVLAPVFAANGWEYFDGVPDEERIRNTLTELVVSLIDDPSYMLLSTGTGRLAVMSGCDDNITVYLELGTIYKED